jgi:formylglycine-generating enzyme required for sulfatase activity
MGYNPSYFKNCGDDCPVENVSWNDVQEFIRRLNKLSEGNYRLPTEAEWEYAARAGSRKAFANGDITNAKDACGKDPNLEKIGWYCGNSDNKTQKVAQKDSNAWSLYDMHGNVWEWCQDLYGEYTADATTDPVGAISGSARVLRGGNWFNGARNCRAAFRYGGTPGNRDYDMGFRFVRLPQVSSPAQ